MRTAVSRTPLVRNKHEVFLELSASQKRAREIMGRNYFGIKEAIKHFGVNPSRQQLAALAEIPFSEAVLQELKNTYILVAVFPFSILDIRGRMSSKRLPNNQALLADQLWYKKESFAKERGEASWYLIRKTPVPDSTLKNWHEQQAFLGDNDEVPAARVMVYTIIGFYLATRERLFEKIYVRCLDYSDMVSGGGRVFVGFFDSDGLGVRRDWDASRGALLGLASVRKFDSTSKL